MGHDQRRRRRPHDDSAGGQGGGAAAGKRTRTQAIGARRPSPPAGTAHEPRPTGAVAAALDGLLDPFGLHLLGNDDQATEPTASNASSAIDGSAAAPTSAGALLRSDPIRRQFGQTRVGEVSAPQPVRITNLTDDALELVDAIVDGPMFRFLGMDAQELGPGESTHVHLGFEPTAEKLASGSCTIETDRGMGVSVRLIGRGTASLADGLAARDPAAEVEQAAKDHAETKADHRGAARRGEVDVAPTYASMAAAFELAIEEAGRGNQRWAHTLAVAVRDRLAEVAPEGRVVAALREHGVSLHAALFELGVAKEATTNLASRLANDHDVAQQRLLARFQTGRATIELVTGESDDAGKYAAFDRASVLTTGVVSAVPVAVAVAVAAPEVVSALIVRATPIAIAEAATFWFATKEVFAWGANYVLANPQAALAWTEFLGPLVIEGAENWGQRDQFIERLQTRDGFLSVLMQMMMGLAEVRQVSGGGRRGGPSDGPEVPAPGRPRSSRDDDGPGPALPRGATDDAGEAPDLTVPATRLVQDGLDELAALANGIRSTRAGVDEPGSRSSAATDGPAVEQLDPRQYRPVSMRRVGGTMPKRVLVDGATGKHFLFKPDRADAPIPDRAVAAGIAPETISSRARAADVAANLLGIDTPSIRIVQYEGEIGSLQEWRSGSNRYSLAVLEVDHPALYAKVVASSEYARLRSSLDTFDYAINNLDRNKGNLLVTLDDTGKLLEITGIDHDLTFTGTSERFTDDLGLWAKGLPDRYSRPLVEKLRENAADPEKLKSALRTQLSAQEIDAALTRINAILADVDAKLSERGAAGTFFEDAATAATPTAAARMPQSTELLAERPPLERTFEHALNPQSYVDDVVAHYRISLRGVKAVYDSTLEPGKLGVTREGEGGMVIRIGRDAFVDQATLANTIAHELSHARDYQRGAHKPHGDASSVGDGSAYGAGNALEHWIRKMTGGNQ